MSLTASTVGRGPPDHYGKYMTDFRPALSIVATPKKRTAMLELATEAERRGFSGIACPSLGATMGLCVSLAHVTTTIAYWTSIQPIYYSHPIEMANTAAHIHEVSSGRFRLGLGVSHGPVVKRLNVETGKPLSDIRNFVEAMRSNERFGGDLPPIYLATLRDKMLDLATEIADGAIWANASLSHMGAQLMRIPHGEDFFTANMIPTVIDPDRSAGDAINRRTLQGYVILPNYRNYWRAAGHGDVMDAIEHAIESGDKDAISRAMTDEWLHDCTLSGSASEVREGLQRWADCGVTPIAVMSSTSGGQAKAIGELFAAYE